MKKKNHSGIFVLSLTIIAAIVVIVTYASDFMPEELEEYTEFSPKDYESLEMENSKIYQGELILVNQYYACKMMEMDKMVAIYDLKNDDYQVKDTKIMANQSTIEALNNMLSGFKQKTGICDVNITSAFRDEELQQELFDEKVEQTDEKEAVRWVARPGYSEHHSGYALDFGIYSNGVSSTFTGSWKYRWICEHAHEYGFILRYDAAKENLTGIAGESWHFRYIGKPHAFFMKQQNLCLEEYIELLKSYPYQRKHLKIEDFDGKKYEVYYVKADSDITMVPVPKHGKYTVSGNNADGFIVTAELL